MLLLGFGAIVSTGCVFGDDDDDDDDDPCITKCEDTHEECSLDCDDDECIATCDDDLDVCQTDCG